MSDETLTVAELRSRLVSRATEDGTFRSSLLADPKAAIREELGLTIPEGFAIKVHEDVADTSHVVLRPPAALAESEMEEAAGGQVFRWSNRWNPAGEYIGIDNAITFWDDFNGPTYHGGPKHNAD